MNTRTAHTSRTRLAAITAVLAGGALLLTGCGDKSDNDTANANDAAPAAEESASPTENVWQGDDESFNDAYHYLVIDGDKVLYIRTDVNGDRQRPFDDIESGNIDENADYVSSIGTLSDSKYTVEWTEGINKDSTRPIDISQGIVTTTVDGHENETFSPYDSEQSERSREEEQPWD